MKSILFVCLGNICRSPLAEGIAKEIAQKKALHVTIDSAGTGNWHVGEAPCKGAQKVAKKHGIDIANLRAREVSKEDLERFELLVALDNNNLKDLQSMGADNVLKLGDFGYEGADVPDPYFFDGYDGFEEVYTMIKTCVTNLLEEKIERVKQ